jgi:nucleoside-diphosphate-sugar epimerase
MRYLICGGGGFIGTHLARHLLADGHQVTTLDPRRCNLRGVHHIYGSAAEPRLMQPLMSRHDGVFHLAAVVGFAKVMADIRGTVTETTSTAATVFELAAQTKTRTLFTSTSAVYGRGNGHPAKETDDALVGPSPTQSWSYAYAKAAAECLAFAYHREAEAPIIVTRVFNTVGPGQSAEAGFVLPRFCRQAVRGELLTVYHPGTQRRTFCHVRDVVRGLADLMTCDQAVGELVNVGGTANVTMTELAQIVQHRANSESRIVLTAPPYPVGYDDIEAREPDLTKVGGLIDYAPRYSLGDMVDETLAEVTDRKLALV